MIICLNCSLLEIAVSIFFKLVFLHLLYCYFVFNSEKMIDYCLKVWLKCLFSFNTFLKSWYCWLNFLVFTFLCHGDCYTLFLAVFNIYSNSRLFSTKKTACVLVYCWNILWVGNILLNSNVSFISTFFSAMST